MRNEGRRYKKDERTSDCVISQLMLSQYSLVPSSSMSTPLSTPLIVTDSHVLLHDPPTPPLTPSTKEEVAQRAQAWASKFIEEVKKKRVSCHLGSASEDEDEEKEPQPKKAKSKEDVEEEMIEDENAPILISNECGMVKYAPTDMCDLKFIHPSGCVFMIHKAIVMRNCEWFTETCDLWEKDISREEENFEDKQVIKFKKGDFKFSYDEVKMYFDVVYGDVILTTDIDSTSVTLFAPLSVYFNNSDKSLTHHLTHFLVCPATAYRAPPLDREKNKKVNLSHFQALVAQAVLFEHHNRQYDAQNQIEQIAKLLVMYQYDIDMKTVFKTLEKNQQILISVAKIWRDRCKLVA